MRTLSGVLFELASWLGKEVLFWCYLEPAPWLGSEVRFWSHPQPAPCLGSEASKTVGQLPKPISIPSMSRYEYLALLSELPPCVGNDVRFW